MSNSKQHISTRLLHQGNLIKSTQGTVNPPVHHASTIIFDSLEKFENCYKLPLDPGESTYAIHGTSIQHALACAITELEDGFDTLVTNSGLLSITLSLGAMLSPGDHLLITDSVYGPTRAYCDRVLSEKLDVSVTYYDPCIDKAIESLIQENTRVIFLESPGSYTFEIQDIKTIAQIAQTRGITTIIDNTWATPLYCKPLELGINISVHAVTKYIAGHADVMLGSITGDKDSYPKLHNYARLMGNHAAPDDCYLALRGLRTLPVRLRQQEENANTIAEWLADRDEVKQVIHPSRPDHPNFDLWQKQYSGSSGLFGLILHRVSKQSLAEMLDKMQLFGMGFSWGGYESLLVPAYLNNQRTVSPYKEDGHLMRLSVGLEDVNDLIADLDAGLNRLNTNSINQY